MAASNAYYTHDNKIIIIKNTIQSSNVNELPSTKFRLPKGTWQRKLDYINKKINKKWNINDNIQWSLSINNQQFKSNNTQQFQQILSIIPDPITLNIISVKLCVSIHPLPTNTHNTNYKTVKFQSIKQQYIKYNHTTRIYTNHHPLPR